MCWLPGRKTLLKGKLSASELNERKRGVTAALFYLSINKHFGNSFYLTIFSDVTIIVSDIKY